MTATPNERGGWGGDHHPFSLPPTATLAHSTCRSLGRTPSQNKLLLFCFLTLSEDHRESKGVVTTTPTTPFGARSNNQEGDPAMTELDHTFSAPPTDEDRLRYRLAKVLPVTTGKEHNIDALVAAGVTLPDPPTATTTMTPLEAIAYLHGTLPARPELYEDDEHTAALLALGPLVGAQPESLAQVRSDEAQRARGGTFPQVGEPGVVNSEAQPAEPLTCVVLESGQGTIDLDYKGNWPPPPLPAKGAMVDVYPHGSRPAPRKVTAELTATPEAVAAAVCEGFGGGRVCDTFDPDVAAAAVLAILASKAGA